MKIGVISGATRNLGAPPDWNAEEHGVCDGLPIRDGEHAPGLPMMTSAWFPMPDELAALNAGAPVHLTVVGIGHPPVAVGVGEPGTDARAPLEFQVADRIAALTYTNWKGESARRQIVPMRLFWGCTQWHPDFQWLLEAWDINKAAVRIFALASFGAPTEAGQ